MMASQAKFQVKKAKISIDVEGCLECGTNWSSDWTVERNVEIVVGAKKKTISIYICADCAVIKEASLVAEGELC